MALRGRQVRNMLATMLLSQGTPMLLAGDEVGRTQRGNNNAYCQDNEISAGLSASATFFKYAHLWDLEQRQQAPSGKRTA